MTDPGASGSAIRYVCFLAWSSLLLAAGLALFTGGFLLHRQVLPDKSVCSSSVEANGSCNPVPRQFSKAIVIIIDALKYEFVVYNDSLGAGTAKPYQNRLPVIKNLTGGPGHLYEFLADPPTTTMQRLKGLTTGSLPTFIDLSSNFASYEINEDNIIDQLRGAGKRVVFAGDDTWMGLFPGRFTRAFPYPSFDVWDLDTVDTGVTKHLYQELKRPHAWEVFIGHYLGVDHAGHKYGPNHAEMGRKLDEMNDVISHVSQNMPSDCVLFVMGDHGMTMTGDHGGDSRDEVSAALFVYSKANGTSSGRLRDDTVESDGTLSINQVDFVPTFSLLMGIPIPFSNLGKVIKDVVVSAAVKQIQYMKVNVEQVFRYLETYTTQGSGSPLPNASYADIKSMTVEFRSKRSASVVTSAGDVQQLLAKGAELLTAAKAMCQMAFIEFDLGLMHTGLTLVFIHLCLLLVLAITQQPGCSHRKSFLRNVINSKFLFNLVVTWGVGTCFTLMLTSSEANLTLGTLVRCSSIGSCFSLMVYGFTLLWKLRNSLSDVFASSNSFVTDWTTGLNWTLGVGLCLCLFSNSFVVEEAQVLSFALSTTLALMLLKTPLGQHRKLFVGAVLATAGLVRLGGVYFRCREEQQGHCNPTDFHKPIGNLPQDVSRAYKNWRFFFTISSVLLVVFLPYQWLRTCGNLNDMFSVPTAVAKFVPPSVGVALVFHWALQGLPPAIAAKLLPLLPAWQHNVLAHFVLAAAGLSALAVAASPKLVFLYSASQQQQQQGNRGPRRTLVDPSDGVKTYYNMLKSNWKQNSLMTTSNGHASTEKKILLYGIGTGISSVFVLFATLFILVSMLISGDGLCPSVCLMFLTTICYLFVTSWARITSAFTETEEGKTVNPTHAEVSTLTVVQPCSPVVSRLYHVPWSTVIGWHLMEQFYFYATGHQPTFPTIPWSAAFVGGFNSAEFGASTSDSVVTSYVVPAVLVGWNTYASRLWFGFLLPLLLLAPFAVWLVLPVTRTQGRKFQDLEDPQSPEEELSKGEVLLLENKEETRSQLFSLCVKYQVLLCLKVLASMMAAAVLRRHLMIWKIFAPRFIFEGVGLGVSLASVLAGYAAFARIQNYVSCYYSSVNKTGKEE